jgi:hypothetical protein
VKVKNRDRELPYALFLEWLMGFTGSLKHVILSTASASEKLGCLQAMGSVPQISGYSNFLRCASERGNEDGHCEVSGVCHPEHSD